MFHFPDESGLEWESVPVVKSETLLFFLSCGSSFEISPKKLIIFGLINASALRESGCIL